MRQLDVGWNWAAVVLAADGGGRAEAGGGRGNGEGAETIDDVAGLGAGSSTYTY